MRSLLLTSIVAFSFFPIFSQSVQERPYSIKGKVVDDRGNPVPKARIQASLPYNVNGVAYSDDDGSFVIGVPRVGPYALTVVNTGLGSPSTYDRFYHPHDKSRPTVVVEEGRTTSAITLVLPARHATIKGAIVEAGSRRPVPSATIRLCRLDEPNYCSTTRLRDRSGSFNLAVIDGPFSVEISSEGYDPWFMTLRDGLRAGSSRQLDIAIERESSASDMRSGRLPAPDIVFPTDGEELFGFPRITKLQWSPVPDAASYSVELEGCQGNTKEKGCFNSFPIALPRYPPMSGIKGTSYEFEFLGNQPGRYRIWAVDADGKPGKKTPWIVFYYPWTL